MDKLDKNSLQHEHRTGDTDHFSSKEKEEKEKKEQKEKEEKEKEKKEKEETQKNIEAVLSLIDKKTEKELTFEEILKKSESFLELHDNEWIHAAQHPEVEETIRRLREELVKCKMDFSNESLLPHEVVENASGGILLKGTYLSKTCDDTFSSQKPLIQLKKESLIKFKSPIKSEQDYTTDFETKRQRDDFVQNVESFGFTTAIKGGLSTVVFGLGGSDHHIYKKESHKETKKQGTEIFLERISCSFVPVAQWEPQIDNFCLSADALHSLRNVEKLLMLKEIKDAQTKTKRFFEIFGSHIFLGDVHFGGVYKLETIYTSATGADKTVTKTMIQNIHSLAIHAKGSIFAIFSAEGGLSVNGSWIEASIEGKFEKSETQKVLLSESKIGGPTGINIVSLWKKGLLLNNNTWAVIDRGELNVKNYIGVWVLLLKHEGDFENASNVARFLKEEWEKINDTKIEDDFLLDCFSLAQKKIDTVTEKVWARLKIGFTPEMCVSALQEILTEVQNIENEIGNNTAWKNQLQKNHSIGNLFHAVTKEHYSAMVTAEIKSLVTKLLNKAGDATFAHVYEVKLWLKKRTEPESIDFLSKLPLNGIDELLEATESELLRKIRFEKSTIHTTNCSGEKEIEKETGIQLANAVSKVLDTIRTTDHCQFLLLIALVTPLKYDTVNKVFKSMVSVEVLETFLNNAKCMMKKYRETKFQDQAKKEAWIFSHLVKGVSATTWITKVSMPSTVGLLRCQYMSEILAYLKHVYLPLDAEVRNMLFARDVEDFESLLGSLQHFISHGKTNQRVEMLSWNYFENIPESFYSQIRCNGSGSVLHSNRSSLHVSSEEISYILEQLGLKAFFPGKLTLNKVLTIRNDMFTKAEKLVDIPWVIIRKIISIHADFREVVLDDFLRTISKVENHEADKGDIFDDCADSDSDESITSKGFDVSHFHPIDVFLTIFQCCDPFLKSVIAQKMAVCQLAIPFIYNDFSAGKLFVSLWPLREIFLEGISKSVVEQPFKIVSFLRLGKNKLRSKSKLINEIIRDQNEEHNTFFHSDCPLGLHQRKLSNGLIEISWFVPQSKSKLSDEKPIFSKDSLTRSFAIMNLRGDVMDYEEQIHFLTRISSMIVIVTQYENLESSECFKTLSKIHQSKAVVMLLSNFTDKQKLRSFREQYQKETKMNNNKTKFVSTFNLKKSRYYNGSEMKEMLRQHINDVLEKSENDVCLEEIARIPQNEMEIDEKDDDCEYAKKKSLEILRANETKEKDISEIKHFLLPLQGEKYWHRWSIIQKENYRIGKRDAYDSEETNLKCMNKIRRDQIEACNTASNTMAHFIQTLVENCHEEKRLLFFISWVKQYMNSKSKVVIPKLIHDFSIAFQKHEETKSTARKKAVDEAEKKLAHASFGLEHFFREMGQIFESFICCKDDMKCTLTPKTSFILDQLPYVMAKLLLIGQPLEIMDGDAANVPLKWVKAVFRELENIVESNDSERKKIFSISVLGVQSSGKSTLLNTMFGLQFAVSAGRCTRGIFIQLVPVDRSQCSLPFDYAMVVDTEGLRAPELAGEKVHHDNELATLVIGLADVVVINIKGETIADMENVLQIVVHGIIRLKQANEELELNQTSIFVHQNVSSQDADTKMLQGNQKIVSNLDEMTKEVAAQERFEGISSFKEVIGFNPMKHVKYISDLWHGTPPMAPSSSKYSTKVIDVATTILEDIVLTTKSFLSVQDTCLHLESLWNGILAEDFVFSFRNCLEVKAYSLLEAEYQQLKFLIEDTKLKWWNDNVERKLKKCQSIDEISRCAMELIEDFTANINEKANFCNQHLHEFTQKSELSEHMIHWKESKLKGLKSKAEMLRMAVIEKLEHEKLKYKFRLGSDDRRLEKEKQINEMAKTIANDLKGKRQTYEEMKYHFDQLWSKWFSEVAVETDESPSVKKQKMRLLMHNVLYDKFSTYNNLIQAGLDKIPLHEGQRFIFVSLVGSLRVDDLDHNQIVPVGIKSNVKEYWSKFRGKESKLKACAMMVIDELYSKVDAFLANVSSVDTEVDDTHFSTILHYISSGIENHNKDGSVEFRITPLLMISVALHASRYAFKVFLDINERYEERHSLKLQLLAYRPNALKRFIDTCEAKTDEIIATNIFCAEIEDLIKEKIKRDLPVHIEGFMRGKYNFQKNHLMKVILKQLAQKGNFDEYIQYIKCPETFVLKWITKKTNEMFFTEPTEYSKIAKNKLSEMISDIKKITKSILLERQPKTIHDWVACFLDLIENKNLMTTPVSFHHVTEYCVTNFEDFQICILQQLDETGQNLENFFDSQRPKNIIWKDKTPYVAITESLWGCTEICPWCKEPCQVSDKGHYEAENSCHMCIQHRPAGIGGAGIKTLNNLLVESCNFQVSSTGEYYCSSWCGCQEKDCENKHPMKSYKTYMKSWDIAPVHDLSKSKYWNWFMANYCTQLAKYYGRELPRKIPDSWKLLSVKDAMDSLHDYI